MPVAPEHCETTLINLADNPLPLWDASIGSGDEAWQERLTPISAQLASSDAFIIIAPEWHGMAPAGLKNFFLLWAMVNQPTNPLYWSVFQPVPVAPTLLPSYA